MCFCHNFPLRFSWICVSFSHLLLDDDEQVAYLNCGLVVWAVEQGDFDGDGLGPVLGGLLGGFGGFAGRLLGAIVFPVILWNLAERKSFLWVSEPQIALLCLPLCTSELWFSGRHYVFLCEKNIMLEHKWSEARLSDHVRQSSNCVMWWRLRLWDIKMVSQRLRRRGPAALHIKQKSRKAVEWLKGPSQMIYSRREFYSTLTWLALLASPSIALLISSAKAFSVVIETDGSPATTHKHIQSTSTPFLF